MIHAVVRSISSLDVDFDTYQPDDPENAAVLLDVYVGSHDSQGEELFQVTVCTPAWLVDATQQQGPIVGRHLLIVHAYERKVVDAFLRKIIGNAWGEDWRAVAEKVSRIAAWEFEDYTPAR